MKAEQIIEELVEAILMLERENEKLRKRIERVTQYLEVYEECLEGGED